jgi:hypothetical protein
MYKFCMILKINSAYFLEQDWKVHILKATNYVFFVVLAELLYTGLAFCLDTILLSPDFLLGQALQSSRFFVSKRIT